MSADVNIDLPKPPEDAVAWAHWFLEPNEMHDSRPAPYMNYATLAQFIIEAYVARGERPT